MVRQLDPTKMTMIDVFDFYDQPCLFSCKDEAGNVFLALLIHDDPFIERWLYLETPPIIMANLEAARMDLYTAFRCPQSGMVWACHYDRPSNSWNVGEILPSSLKISELPVPGEFLRIQGN